MFLLQRGTNKGTLSGKTKLDLTIEDQLHNKGEVLASRVAIRGQGALHNQDKGILGGKEKLGLRDVFLINEGDLISAESIKLLNLQGTSENRETGKILSQKVFHMRGAYHFQNKGVVEGENLTEIDLLSLQNGGTLLSSEGQLHLTLQEGTNTGEGKIGSKESLHLKVGSNFINEGTIISQGQVVVFGNGLFRNKNILFSPQNMDFALDVENTERGKIRSDGIIAFQDLNFLKNFGKILGKKGITALFHNFENEGTFLSTDGAVHIALRTGSNKGVIQENRRKTISGKTLIFDIGEWFHNHGDLYAEDEFTLQGDGELFNDGRLLSLGSMSFQNRVLINTQTIQADGPLEISDETSLKNTSTGQIHSNTHIEAKEKAEVENQGAVVSQGTLTFNQPAYTNEGTLQARGVLSLPNCEHLVNEEKGVISSLEGEVLFPRLSALDNVGKIKSHASLTFPSLTILSTTGNISTYGKLTLSLPGDFFPEGTLMGNSGISIAVGERFTNHAVIGSKNDAIAVTAADFSNMNVLSGKGGVSITATSDLTNDSGAKIHSADGAIDLEAPQIQNPDGEIKGKEITIHSKESPFVQEGTVLATDNLTLHVPYGWDLRGGAKEFTSPVSVYGPILNPANLRFKESFTWHNPGGLENNFDILVGGVLTLNLNGSWTNNARVQAENGSHITATFFRNNGEFFSDGNTYFSCPSGFNNYRSVLLQGDVTLSIPSGSFVNRPQAQFEQNGAQNTVTITARDDIFNYAGFVSIEGDLTATSKTFANEIENYKEGDLGSTYLSYSSAKQWQMKVITRHEIPPQNPAIFYAGSADVHATTLRNIGGTISTSQFFRFNGNDVANIKTTYVKDGHILRRHRHIHRRYCYHKGGVFVKDNYSSIPFCDGIDVRPATIHSMGPVTFSTGASLVGEGIKGYTVNITAPTYDTYTNLLQNPPSPLSPMDCLSKYFQESDLLGSTFYVLDAEQESGHQIVPTFTPLTLTNEEINEQTSDTHHMQMQQELASIVSFQRWAQQRGHGHVDVFPAFWEPNPSHVQSYKDTLTHESLFDVPPRIGVLSHPLLQQGGNFRMHHYPTLAAKLLRQSLLQNIGFGSLSRGIGSPVLLLRVLDEEGYIQSRQSHGLEIVPAHPNWDQLTPQQKLFHQLKELVAFSDVEGFQNPAVIYRLLESHGELVLSALMTYPRHIREAFQSHFGQVISNYLNITTTQGNLTLSAPVVARKGVSLTSTGDTSTQDTLTQGPISLNVSQDYENTGDVATQYNNVTATIGETLKNYGTIEGENVSITAKRIHSITPTLREYNKRGFQDFLQRTSTIRARQDLMVEATEFLQGIGAIFEAIRGKVTLKSEGLVDLGAQELLSLVQKGRKYLRQTLTNLKSVVRSGTDSEILSQSDMFLHGVDCVVGRVLHIYSEGNLVDHPVHDTDEEMRRKKKHKKWGSTKTKIYQNYSDTVVRSQRYGGAKILQESEQDNLLKALDMQSGGEILPLSHQGRVFFESDITTYSSSKSKKSKSVVYKSQKGKGNTRQQVEMPWMVATQGVHPHGAQGIVVEVKGDTVQIKNGKVRKQTQSTPLETLLDIHEQDPRTAWIKVVRTNLSVSWNVITEEQKRWRYKSQGLTPGGAAILTLAVGIATASTGAIIANGVSGVLIETMGMTGAHAIGTMASTGFKVLLSQAAISLANHQGNIRKTLEDLGSKENLRGLAISMATAGLTCGISDELGVSRTGTDFSDHLARSAVQSGTSTFLRMASNDLNLRDALL